MMLKSLLETYRPFYRPDDEGGSGGGDIAPDNMLADVEAAFDAVEGGDGDGGAQGLDDGGAPQAKDTREPAGKTGSDGQQAKTPSEDGDRGDGRTQKGQFAPKGKDGKPAAGDKPAQGDKPLLGGAQRGADGAKPGEAGAPDAGALAGTHPPSSFSPRSKASWEQLRAQFPWIAADIAKREGEVGEGFAALRDFKDVKPYADMARNSGTTLATALHRYTNLEQLAKRSPAHGLVSVCASIGMPKAEALEALRHAAMLIGGDIQIPANRTAGGPAANGGGPGDQKPDDPLVAALAPILRPLLQEVGDLRKHISDFSTANRTVAERSLDEAITAFASDAANVYYNDVADDMTRLFNTKMVPLTGNHAADLRACYDMACKLHPQVSEALIEQRLGQRNTDAANRERQIAQRARAAGRSLAGSSSPADIERDTAPGRRGKEKPPDQERLDAVSAAYEQVAGSASY
jgi:hypothetical protein